MPGPLPGVHHSLTLATGTTVIISQGRKRTTRVAGTVAALWAEAAAEEEACDLRVFASIIEASLSIPCRAVSALAAQAAAGLGAVGGGRGRDVVRGVA